MNNFPRVTAILDKIPDAATRWPGWFWPHCPTCGKACEIDAEKDPFCQNRDCPCVLVEITPVYRFDPPTDDSGEGVWHVDDLDARNMHHLWSMLEAVDMAHFPEVSCGMGGYRVEVVLRDAGMFMGVSANIIEAMLRCLEEAVKC